MTDQTEAAAQLLLKNRAPEDEICEKEWRQPDSRPVGLVIGLTVAILTLVTAAVTVSVYGIEFERQSSPAVGAGRGAALGMYQQQQPQRQLPFAQLPTSGGGSGNTNRDLQIQQEPPAGPGASSPTPPVEGPPAAPALEAGQVLAAAPQQVQEQDQPQASARNGTSPRSAATPLPAAPPSQEQPPPARLSNSFRQLMGMFPAMVKRKFSELRQGAASTGDATTSGSSAEGSARISQLALLHDPSLEEKVKAHSNDTSDSDGEGVEVIGPRPGELQQGQQVQMDDADGSWAARMGFCGRGMCRRRNYRGVVNFDRVTPVQNGEVDPLSSSSPAILHRRELANRGAVKALALPAQGAEAGLGASASAGRAVDGSGKSTKDSRNISQDVEDRFGIMGEQDGDGNEFEDVDPERDSERRSRGTSSRSSEESEGSVASEGFGAEVSEDEGFFTPLNAAGSTPISQTTRPAPPPTSTRIPVLLPSRPPSSPRAPNNRKPNYTESKQASTPMSLGVATPSTRASETPSTTASKTPSSYHDSKRQVAEERMSEESSDEDVDEGRTVAQRPRGSAAAPPKHPIHQRQVAGPLLGSLPPSFLGPGLLAQHQQLQVQREQSGGRLQREQSGGSLLPAMPTQQPAQKVGGAPGPSRPFGPQAQRVPLPPPVVAARQLAQPLPTGAAGALPHQSPGVRQPVARLPRQPGQPGGHSEVPRPPQPASSEQPQLTQPQPQPAQQLRDPPQAPQPAQAKPAQRSQPAQSAQQPKPAQQQQPAPQPQPAQQQQQPGTHPAQPQESESSFAQPTQPQAPSAQPTQLPPQPAQAPQPPPQPAQAPQPVVQSPQLPQPQTQPAQQPQPAKAAQAPAQPAQAPAQPVQAPAQETVKPAQPLAQPAQPRPAAAPVQPPSAVLKPTIVSSEEWVDKDKNGYPTAHMRATVRDLDVPLFFKHFMHKDSPLALYNVLYYVAEPMTFGFRDRPEDKAKGVTAPVREYKDESGRDVYEVRTWTTDPSSFKVASMEEVTKFTQWRDEKDGLWKFTIKRETTILESGAFFVRFQTPFEVHNYFEGGEFFEQNEKNPGDVIPGKKIFKVTERFTINEQPRWPKIASAAFSQGGMMQGWEGSIKRFLKAIETVNRS